MEALPRELALRIALANGSHTPLFAIVICAALFAAMGLLFVGGFGVSKA